MANESYLNYQLVEYSNVRENVEIVALSVMSFFLPMFLGHPQLLIGSIVNALLFRAALTTKFTKTLPLILLPSLGVFIGGILFGGFTPYMMAFIPFIWVSNALYVLLAKKIAHSSKKEYGQSVLGASLVKAGVLFVTALVFVNVFAFPAIFLTAMGLLQLTTAVIGGAIALGITKVEKMKG
jgi:hypothetical protein